MKEEKYVISDQFGYMPSEKDYCWNGEKEGWLVYLGCYREDNHFVHYFEMQ